MNKEYWDLFRFATISKEDLESSVRELIDFNSWQDLTVMINRFSLDFIREFEDKFLWYNWPANEVIKKNERLKEFWWHYDV